MDNSLLAVRIINHKYIVVEERRNELMDEHKPSVINKIRTYSDIAKMRADIRKDEIKISHLNHRVTKNENRIDNYSNDERKKRNHRICQKGAHIEYLIPETKELTDEQFLKFCDALFSFPGIRSFIKETISNIKEEK